MEILLISKGEDDAHEIFKFPKNIPVPKFVISIHSSVQSRKTSVIDKFGKFEIQVKLPVYSDQDKLKVCTFHGLAIYQEEIL
jgi:hypothetical protein